MMDAVVTATILGLVCIVWAVFGGLMCVYIMEHRGKTEQDLDRHMEERRKNKEAHWADDIYFFLSFMSPLELFILILGFGPILWVSLAFSALYNLPKDLLKFLKKRNSK